ncbi:hypothetical protein OS493_035900 [Desmophyllum pertusum]|uniref:Uncharacterized protein n=1 Tax=Desmophyllum pertusum TaxID=174260 RepID=A0A9W9ZA08_9CNID|nr:hypothetical protein OS493_035900 [Desmophyllum pertusum]
MHLPISHSYISIQEPGQPVLPTGYIGVIRGIFIGSAFLWISGSLVSSKNKLKNSESVILPGKRVRPGTEI